MKNYACKYTMSFDTNNGKGWLKEDIDQSYEGLADSFLLFSIIHEENGETSIMILPRDDENKKQELKNTDLFNCWIALASTIIESPDPTFIQKDIVQDALNNARNFIEAMKD